MNRYFGLHTLEGEWHAVLPRYLLLSDRVTGKRILDIGCGTGIGSSLLLELDAEMVDAIDHRPAVLELARMKHAKDGLDFHVMFWEELDFPDHTFDIVLCLDPSSPVTDPSLIQEVRRVLKPGGEYICAIERKTIEGVETLLPKYGYADAAENVDVHQPSERVPQIGELSNHFDKVASLVQRPQVAYVFDTETDDESNPDSTRRAYESGESGIWIDEEKEEDNGRWISVDTRLCSHDTETGSVEIWFCGDEALPSPPLREIRLPYYSVVERLRQVINDLQMRQVAGLGGEDSLFDEVIDNAEDEVVDDRENTSEFEAVSWDDEPTGVRERPDLDAYEEEKQKKADIDHLQSQLHELNALYNDVRSDFENMVHEAQQALEERDSYIHHLVTTIHDWEQRYQDVAETHGLPDENTGVFEKPTPGDGDSERSSTELEREIERLRTEQARILSQLERRDEDLRDLRETNDVIDVSEVDETSEVSEVDDGEDSDAADVEESDAEASDVDEEQSAPGEESEVEAADSEAEESEDEEEADEVQADEDDAAEEEASEEAEEEEEDDKADDASE